MTFEADGSIGTHGEAAGSGQDLPATGTRRILDLAFEKLVRFCPGKGELADIPCGTGYLSVCAAREGWSVHPYDILPELWEGGGGLVARKADLNTPLDIPDNEFDALVCCEGIEHIENPYLVLREFRRIVRDGGFVIISIPNTIDLRQRLRFLRRGYLSHYPPFVPGHINMIGTFLLCHGLVRNGFEIVDIDAPKTYCGWAARLLCRLLRFDRNSGLPDNVNAMLSSRKVLCGRTVALTARVRDGIR
jgi:SAM-dependent methyltransferase